MEQNYGHNRLLEASLNSSLKIFGIKNGDSIDLNPFVNTTNSSINQNGTHMQLILGGGFIITSEITMGSSFVNFDFYNGTIKTSV